MQRRSRFAFRVALATVLLLVARWRPLLAQATPVTSQPSADPRALVALYFDTKTSAEERYRAYQQLLKLGPAIEPAVPALCKQLGRRESLPGGHIQADREAAILISQAGPSAGKAAIAAIRAEMIAKPPVGYDLTSWSDVIDKLGAAARPALADSLGDKCAPLAEVAARQLAHQLDKDPLDPAHAPILASIGPKLVAGWQRATTTTFDVDPKQQEQLFQRGLDPKRRRQEWLGALHRLAIQAGPKALDALAAAATAARKQKRPDTAAATAAAKELARAAKLPPHPAGGRGDEYRRAYQATVELGSSAIAPLAELVANDAAARPDAVAILAEITSKTPRFRAADPANARALLILDLPPAPLPLEPRNRTAMAKAVPELTKLAFTLERTPAAESALRLLWTVAPDVPSAADALVANLDKLPEGYAPVVATALSDSDRSIVRKVEAAGAKGNDVAKAVARQVRLRTLPPKVAAAEIVATVPEAQRKDFVSRLIGIAGPEVVPLLIELLPDKASDAATGLRDRAQYAGPAMAAALDRPEPEIRSAVLTFLPREAITPDVAKKAAAMLGEEGLSDGARHVLTRFGSRAMPFVIEQTKSKDAATRAAALRALRVYANDTNSEKATDEARAKVAEVALSLVDDPEPSVRAAALSITSELPKLTRDALAAKLKTSTPQQRQQLAETLVDLGSRSNSWVSLNGLIEEVKKPVEHGGGYEWQPGRGGSRDQVPARVIASLAIEPDPAVSYPAEDVLIRAEVFQSDRNLAQARPPTTQQAELIAKAKSDPDPAARNAARRSATSDQLSPVPATALLNDALNDPSPIVRMDALQSATGLFHTNAPAAPDVLVKLLEIAERDPSSQVREMARRTMDDLRRERLWSILPRIYLMTRSDDPAVRAKAATVLGIQRDPRDSVSARPDGQPSRHLAILLRLLEDEMGSVRRAAVISIVEYVRLDEPDSPAVKAIVKLLDKPADLHPDVRLALLNTVPLLAAAGINLANNPDPDVKAAAAIGNEQPPDSPPLKDRRATVDAAAAALTSPSQRVRRMAGHSLVYTDPADATRTVRGAQALLKASNHPTDAIAIDAIDTLVVAYCGRRVGPGVTTWRQYPGFGEVGTLPTQFEVTMARLLERMFKGAPADRIGAINELAAGGDPGLLAARWDAFIRLLEDPDPQVRAAAFGVARTLTATAVNAYIAKAPKAAAAPAPAATPAAAPAGKK